MEVNNASPIIEVYDNGDDTNAGDGRVSLKGVTGSGTYALVNDINLSAWTPGSFTGKFYGNGHTVTITGMTAAANMGLFGTVETGAIVRDLTVQYGTGGAVTLSSTGAAQFGGIAGTGSANFENVLVKGEVIFNGNNTNFVGGLAGQLTGTIQNAYGGLNLTVTNSGTAVSLYVGGIAGSIGWETAARVEKVSVVGNITVGNDDDRINSNITEDTTDGLFVGGLAGTIRGASGNLAVLDDADYRQGIITVWSGDVVTVIGGALGRNWNAEITTCSSVAGGLDIDKNSGSNQFYVGGFIGDIISTGTIRNCYSENPVVLNTAAEFLGTAVGGGFAGRIGFLDAVSVSYCYAKGTVSTLSNRSYDGGFAGILTTSASASYCYAAGNVRAVSYGGNYVYAGGFAGNSGSLSDCYALGDVFVDRSTVGIIYAGSLIGELGNPAGSTINRCFAAGNVIAQMRYTEAAYMLVGGLVGYNYSTAAKIKNSVSLTKSITVMGIPLPADEEERTFSRILGSVTGSPTLTNNHAYIDMALNHKASVSARDTHSIPSTQIGNETNHKDGKDAHLGTFRSRTFWQNAPNHATAPGLGFSSSNWIFTTVEDRGYPILRQPDANGNASAAAPAMGGQ
jgi:hypothetical protein